MAVGINNSLEYKFNSPDFGEFFYLYFAFSEIAMHKKTAMCMATIAVFQQIKLVKTIFKNLETVFVFCY
jgi:hypothetical protein